MKYRVTNKSETNLSFRDGDKIVTLKPNESAITKNPPVSEGRFKVEKVRKESVVKRKENLNGEK